MNSSSTKLPRTSLRIYPPGSAELDLTKPTPGFVYQILAEAYYNSKDDLAQSYQVLVSSSPASKGFLHHFVCFREDGLILDVASFTDNYLQGHQPVGVVRDFPAFDVEWF